MTRDQILTALKQDHLFDLLIIGAGATGCGIAVDAAARGFKVALLDKQDIAEGTSSRSTKLVHGGVRYLEKAVKHLDREQYDLVREGLHERGILLKNAPHLSNKIIFITPLYKWLDVPMVFAGLKLYDFLSGKMRLGSSRLLSRKETLERFPAIKAQGLKASILYYDGQFNDARMAVSLARTAEQQGAIIGNHIEVVDLLKENGKVCGVKAKDTISGASWAIKAKGVINATGPFSDAIRKMDDPAVEPVITVSSGIHIVLDKSFAPPANGLMIPETEDGRVLFVLPWQGHALVGTTDEPAEISDHPRVSDADIAYLLRHVGNYFNLKPTRTDVKATWSGLRPLVSDPQAVDTSNLVRDHVISMSENGLLSILGGKWTSYRRMAEDTIDQAIIGWRLQAKRPCSTEQSPIIGGAHYDPRDVQKLNSSFGFDDEVSNNLNHSYGDQALMLAEEGREADLNRRLHPNHPYIEAEVLFAARHEFALRAIDVLARRTPLALIDQSASLQVLPRVIEIMAKELGWDQQRRDTERDLAIRRLEDAL
ncbi:glycerol-3-phosphate dehydrogenase [Malonomonas rubra DSM 5091]|uniref:Glycerol-3-phosphate dehydrogenase n=1 Tax=Malonomonas rubra DSM 5091 TaxID=1122189 RepID=A0A1M6I3Y8_MALRU|nr:FAD-dependent oxidoreductase [Malonomonas rubra]SHJ29173.1 glycerol-3-phosphate dehydrogenase [Malonomonas rubra DSM 5091]